MWSYSKRAGCACVASGSRKLLKPMPTSRKHCSVLSSTRSRNASENSSRPTLACAWQIVSSVEWSTRLTSVTTPRSQSR
jgi:hypothetical protein